MAPPRPYWKGYLKLSLVSCPVALYSATSAGERVAFRQISKKTGNRLRQQLIDEGTGDPIEPDDKGRGYEVEKGVYLPVEDEELDAVAIESSHTIDIDSFVPKSEIDERYVDSPYYLTPENKVALEAFAVIRDAMRGKGMVALGRVVLAKRERVVMLQARGKGLLGATLRYPYEVRDDAIYFGDIPDVHIPKDMLALAEHILESKAAAFDPTLFHDRYEEAVVTMLNDKRAGMPVSTERPMPRIVAGTDLMAALRQSIEAAGKKTPAKPAAAPKAKPAAKGNPNQRELDAEQTNMSAPPPMLLGVRGMGPEFASVLWSEGLSRHFDNRRQVAAYAGLAPTPWQSGSVNREQGISQSGNPRLRTTMIQFAWLWIRHQPGSALALWFKERNERNGGRRRKTTIVALARKLLVALWKYVSAGVVIEGAMTGAA
jgi:DNA end-binding protein Ku